MSSAHASSPTGTASQSTLASIRSCWTNAVPHVATSPKKTNTETSPSPLAAYGFGPPEYRASATHSQGAGGDEPWGGEQGEHDAGHRRDDHHHDGCRRHRARGREPGCDQAPGPMRAAVSTPLTPSK